MTELLIADKDLDVQVAKILGLNVVCMDWPCGHDPECGVFHAIPCKEWVKGSPGYEPYPVYLPRDGRGIWPAERMEGEAWDSESEENRWIANVEPVPQYSTDIATAMVAMEWVWQLKPWANIFRIEDGYGIDTDMPPWITGHVVEAETLPLAICKAVLAIEKYEREEKEHADDPD